MSLPVEENKPRIVSRIAGGLGNQLFRLAAGIALARRWGCGLDLDLSLFGVYRKRTYLLDHFDLGAIGIRTLPNPPSGVREATYFEPHFHFDPEFCLVQPPATLEGYFISERYFSEATAEVRAALVVRKPFSSRATAVADRIASATLPVSIHVRRGDYLMTSKFAPLPPSYYRRALWMIERLLGARPDYFIFTDDPAFVAASPDFPAEAFIVDSDTKNPTEDLMLMARCRHHIIANSTFSWWGAWLNAVPDKIVIAPRGWHKPAVRSMRNPADLIPDGWITI